MSEANVEVVRRLWNAVDRGEMEAVFALYDPAIVWENHTGGPAELQGTYHGHEGVRQWFRQWLQSFENFRPLAETFKDAGENVIVGNRLHGQGKSSGAEVEMHRWNVYTIRNGLVVRVEIFETKAQALEAAGLSGDTSPP